MLENKLTELKIAIDSLVDAMLDGLKKIQEQLGEGDAESAALTLEDMMEELEKYSE